MADETLDDKIAISNLHKELQRIENKDGLFTEAEKKRIAILQQTLNSEPALLKVLAHMEARQEKEPSTLVQQHKGSAAPGLGRSPLTIWRSASAPSATAISVNTMTRRNSATSCGKMKSHATSKKAARGDHDAHRKTESRNRPA